MRTVKEVSRLTGVSVRTLQYYDRIGLLCPACRTQAGYRLYDQGSLERLQQILLFRELGVSADAVRCTRNYEKNLAVGHYFLPGAEEAVASLSQKYRLFLASNGTASVQAGRLTSANLYRFFETVFISQELGFNKHAKEFFDACFARIPDFDPKKAVMVGDSLTSDILGGKNAGITTVWVNPERRLPHPEIVPDYEIESLAQLEALLETM